MIISNENINWTAHKLALSIFQQLDSEKNLILSTTWASIDDSMKAIKDWLSKDFDHRVIVVSLFDPDYFPRFYRDRIQLINSDHVCFWLLACGAYFNKYNFSEVAPVEFKHRFLCYQRKITPQREILHNELIPLKQGIITIEKYSYPFNKNLPHNVGFDEEAGTSPIPNDIWTLGNIKLWNSAFLNIISETDQPVHTDIPFLSEKSFKPIIGMRPFLGYGHPNISQCLRSKGFETFDEDFGYTPSQDHQSNAKQIKNIVGSLDSLELLYNKLLPKIQHNKNVFDQAVIRESDNLQDIINAYR
jgi:hypothetical protein